MVEDKSNLKILKEVNAIVLKTLKMLHSNFTSGLKKCLNNKGHHLTNTILKI